METTRTKGISMSSLIVKNIKNVGRGVFAQKSFKKGQLIECSPVIILDSTRKQKTLKNYVFEWTKGKYAIALGYGSLYNHSYYPNARYSFAYNSKTISFYARRPIKKGEEIRVNYNGCPYDTQNVWFKVK